MSDRGKAAGERLNCHSKEKAKKKGAAVDGKPQSHKDQLLALLGYTVSLDFALHVMKPDGQVAGGRGFG